MCKIKGRKQQLVTLGPDTVLREHTVNELLCVQYVYARKRENISAWL